MKKIITTALALVLTFGMSVTAFAAGSVSKDVTGGETTLADGTSYQATITTLDDATTAAAAAKATEMVSADSKVIEAVDVTLPTTISESNPATVAFTIASVTAGTDLTALHQKADGTWEALDCVWKDGKVYVTFTSLSPVVFVSGKVATTGTGAVADNPAKNDIYVNNSSAAASDGVTSPKTADAGVFGFAAVAVFCGAALVCVNRKKAA